MGKSWLLTELARRLGPGARAAAPGGLRRIVRRDPRSPAPDRGRSLRPLAVRCRSVAAGQEGLAEPEGEPAAQRRQDGRRRSSRRWPTRSPSRRRWSSRKRSTAWSRADERLRTGGSQAADAELRAGPRSGRFGGTRSAAVRSPCSWTSGRNRRTRLSRSKTLDCIPASPGRLARLPHLYGAAA